MAVGGDKAFRNDINGLRAWAVLSVVLYHFGIPGFMGGFAGVDIFFVISGFLMTGIVVSGLERGSLSVLDFYYARVKRILPALIVLCVVLLMLGWFLLSPDDYQKLAEHVRDTLLFVSNNTYRKESGYFDAVSHEKWLLHTWSLSVEWQFYLWLPVLSTVAWRIRKSRGWLFALVLVAAIFSVVACIDKTAEAPTKAFYLIKYRYWEMLVGACAYFLSSMSWANNRRFLSACYWISLPALVIPVFFLSSEVGWPGYAALIPVLGAAGFILAARTEGYLPNHKIVGWLGDRSYSVYLWHWPVVVLVSYFQLGERMAWVVAGLIGSLVLAEFSYRFVEMPFRRGASGIGKRAYPWLVVAAAGVVCGLAVMLIRMQGIPARVDPLVAQIAAEKNNQAKGGRDCLYGEDRSKGPLSCRYGEGELRIIVAGDSHASALVTAVQTAVAESGSVSLWARAACPFVRGVTAKIDQNCAASLEWAMAELGKIPANVPLVVIARSSLYPLGANEGVVGAGKPRPTVFFDNPHSYPDPEFLEQYRERSISTICEVAARRDVYLLKPIPEMKVSVPQVMARAKMMHQELRVSVTLQEYRERHAYTLSLMDEMVRKCGVKLIDPLPYLCDAEKCYGDKDGWPLYFDDDHLSEFGNKLLVPAFRAALARE